MARARLEKREMEGRVQGMLAGARGWILLPAAGAALSISHLPG